MHSKKLEIGGIEINFSRKSVKNINLRVSRTDGSVSVSAPYYLPESAVKSFVISRLPWIEKTRGELSEKATYKEKYRDGETVFLNGKKYTLRTLKGKKTAAETSGDFITLTLREITEENCKKALFTIYKKELCERAKRLIAEAESVTGLKAGELTFRNMKTRWGSCNVKSGKICFNLALAEYDDSVLRYIAFHEILHIKYHNHGKEFKAALTKYCPEWKNLRKKLNGGIKGE